MLYVRALTSDDILRCSNPNPKQLPELVSVCINGGISSGFTGTMLFVATKKDHESHSQELARRRGGVRERRGAGRKAHLHVWA